MKILLIGKNGQVGWELQRSLSTFGELIAVDPYSNHDLCGDLTDLQGIANTIRTVQPDVVVNAAAHTSVDKAENEKDLARLLNAESVEIIAKETAKLSALLVHYSTDYIFNGKGTHYYQENEKANPLNVYGKTKLAGEIAVVVHNQKHFIFRTSWVYAARGANFIKTMLHIARKTEQLSVINDQFGAPTGAELLADCTAIAIRNSMYDKSLYGTYHLVASGETNWYEYAKFIFKLAIQEGESLKLSKVRGVAASFYLTTAKRPSNSRLSNKKFQNTFNVILPHWRIGVERVVTEILGK